jgi:hypothetical protein
MKFPEQANAMAICFKNINLVTLKEMHWKNKVEGRQEETSPIYRSFELPWA